MTQTELFDTAGVPGWLEKHSAMPAYRVVKKALKAMEKRRQFIVPGWKNYLLTLLVRMATRRTAVNESKRFFRPSARNVQADNSPQGMDHSPANSSVSGSDHETTTG